eukprot:Gb_18591 [translate_table: standard]
MAMAMAMAEACTGFSIGVGTGTVERNRKNGVREEMMRSSGIQQRKAVVCAHNKEDERRRRRTTRERGCAVEELMERAEGMMRAETSPPRWFCPLDCGTHPVNAPLLLYLPGIDGTGLGMILHHESLGALFEVRCLHIPATDRTSFEGLVVYVEETLKLEVRRSSSRPIYLLGECLGGCLALALAARNPEIDLALILVNPATSFSKSPLQPWFPLMKILPNEFYLTMLCSITSIMGDPIRMGLTNVDWKLPPLQRVQKLSTNLTALLPKIPMLTKLIPRETLLWKLKMLQSAELYTNARLHAVKSNVLLLASGKDQFLPSTSEALRLKRSLKSCKVRYFKENGHTLLLEESIDLSTVVKGVGFYRHSRTHDYVLDFIPPTPQESERSYEDNGLMRKLTSPVMFSTNQDGKIVKGLSGIPEEGPVLFVGIHMLMGFEIAVLVGELFKQRNILIRGIGHPIMFGDILEGELQEPSFYDQVRLHGAVPSSGKNLFKLLSSKSFILLYPGGAREALHRKGEEYKLFWPEKAEFIRMAARFKATIIPFGIVGEDDIAEVLLDYDDVIKIPYYNDMLDQLNKDVQNVRSDMSGEVANQQMYLPFLAPKPPGRLYFLFGKPISTAGRRSEVEDKAKAQHLYVQIKGEVEAAIAYLLRKREEDPYRHFLPRFLYEASSGFTRQMPTFDP